MRIKIINTSFEDNKLLVFFNGFGTSFCYWNHLIKFFPNHNAIMLSEDYFDEGDNCTDEMFEKICKNKEIIGIGHSLGYQKLVCLAEKYDFFKPKKLIALEGFSTFLSHIPFVREIRNLSVNAMKVLYSINPFMTLYVFQIACGEQFPYIPHKINKKKFLEDLNILFDDVKSPEIPHLVMSSLDDPIIPFYVIEDNFRKLQNKEIDYSFFSMHLLGTKNEKRVAAKISDFIAN